MKLWYALAMCHEVTAALVIEAETPLDALDTVLRELDLQGVPVCEHAEVCITSGEDDAKIHTYTPKKSYFEALNRQNASQSN